MMDANQGKQQPESQPCLVQGRFWGWPPKQKPQSLPMLDAYQNCEQPQSQPCQVQDQCLKRPGEPKSEVDKGILNVAAADVGLVEKFRFLAVSFVYLFSSFLFDRFLSFCGLSGQLWESGVCLQSEIQFAGGETIKICLIKNFSLIDTHTGERVAIKKMANVFEYVSDATRILREIKLLRLLRHPDIVQIKHIMLPPCRREFKDIYVVFELMESDLHEVIEANDDLTPGHYQFFLYQLLRALKYIHSANVFHRDLKPKNILANADCKLKICDFGLARPSFGDTPSTIFWTDYVATRWYRAPELCGSFFSKYTPAIDIWSIGCIFAEMLTGKPLFPGKNVVHQLDLITDLLGTPPVESIARIRNEKARRYLYTMGRKSPIPFSEKFPNADPMALHLLERLLALDPKQRPSAEEALADPYFDGLANLACEPSMKPISKFEFDFERRRLTKEDVRELIYKEILEYHPQMLQEYLHCGEKASFMYPSGVDVFKQQFAELEENCGKCERRILQRKYTSLPRERVCTCEEDATDRKIFFKRRNATSVVRAAIQSPPRSMEAREEEEACRNSLTMQNGSCNATYSGRRLLKSDSISASVFATVMEQRHEVYLTAD
ncbi:hypothetical protein L6164_026738 [Bauhinia variegata]|uniref:Uncharacterized protein n=1 Tax=Bauhinia variegata TaxID=167791 RepID=A0ACB9LRF7_BAUVA|nr:hypothetical protein L6164_026738 [Bauhinia variegata]